MSQHHLQDHDHVPFNSNTSKLLGVGTWIHIRDLVSPTYTNWYSLLKNWISVLSPQWVPLLVYGNRAVQLQFLYELSIQRHQQRLNIIISCNSKIYIFFFAYLQSKPEVENSQLCNKGHTVSFRTSDLSFQTKKQNILHSRFNCRSNPTWGFSTLENLFPNLDFGTPTLENPKS